MQIPSLEERLPASTLTSAQVLCETDNERNPQFRVYVPVKVAVPPVPEHMTNAIAFTYHNETFAYAVLAPEGHLLAVGEVFVPVHVRRKPDAINYSETYVHEITKEMVRLAQQYHAYIGVEDISYRKDQPSSSRAENRELFAVPFSTIMEALHNKALLAGLPEPHRVSSVPWRRACGQCGRDLARGVVAFSQQKVTICPSCEARYAGKYRAVPIVLNPVAVICNVPKLGRRRLQMSGPTLAGIFLRAITDWNDPRIAADNPGVPLPDVPITVITDTNDASVASVFNGYLEGVLAASDEIEESWRAWFANGRGRLRVPSPFQARSVSDTIAETEGAIGCVAWSPDSATNQRIIAVQNQAGRFVQPSPESIGKAGKALIREMQQGNEPTVLAGSAGTVAYPLTGVTWVRLPQGAPNAEQAVSTATFVSWLLTEGRAIAADHGSLPVPTAVRDAALAVLRKMGAQDNVPVQSAVHTNGREQETNLTLTPRLQPVPISGAGAAAGQDAYQHWITHYRHVEPQVNLMLQPIHPDQEIKSEAFCPACDRKTVQIEELYMNCRRCGTMVPAQYNRAVVAGRMLQEQLVWRYEYALQHDAEHPAQDDAGEAMIGGEHDDW
jgi:phosphate transport system substrate-binding protein